jgi:hypothetical protein
MYKAAQGIEAYVYEDKIEDADAGEGKHMQHAIYLLCTHVCISLFGVAYEAHALTWSGKQLLVRRTPLHLQAIASHLCTHHDAPATACSLSLCLSSFCISSS